MKVTYAALASALVLVAAGAQAKEKPTLISVGPQPVPIPTREATLPAPVAVPAVVQPLPAIVSAGQAVLRVGTPVPLRMAEGLTTEGKKLRVGQRFRMETAEPVSVDGQTVIPAGSPVMGEVTEVRNKGMWGKSGRINGRVLYVQANGRQIRMSGQLDDKGRTGTAGVVASVALVPIAGFFVTGTSARIPMGGAVNGFIDEDIPLAFAVAAPAPMVVAAPAAPMAVVAASAPAGAPAVATTVVAPAPAVVPAVATIPAKAQ